MNCILRGTDYSMVNAQVTNTRLQINNCRFVNGPMSLIQLMLYRPALVQITISNFVRNNSEPQCHADNFHDKVPELVSSLVA